MKNRKKIVLEYFYRQRFKKWSQSFDRHLVILGCARNCQLANKSVWQKKFPPSTSTSVINSNSFESLIHWNLLQNCKVIRALLSVSAKNNPVGKIPLVKIKLVPLKTVNKFITSEGWKCIKVHKNGSKKWKLKKLQTLAFCSLQNELFSKFHTEHGALFFIH